MSTIAQDIYRMLLVHRESSRERRSHVSHMDTADVIRYGFCSQEHGTLDQQRVQMLCSSLGDKYYVSVEVRISIQIQVPSIFQMFFPSGNAQSHFSSFQNQNIRGGQEAWKRGMEALQKRLATLLENSTFVPEVYNVTYTGTPPAPAMVEARTILQKGNSLIGIQIFIRE